MRHVTDGELHAFLDGGLDLLTGDRGAEVRDHVAECPVCRERLQDEETIRARAAEILGDPGLDKLSLPTFEELRERASAPSPDSPPSRDQERGDGRFRGPLTGLPLAWAATIVLALGVGWMGGQLWRTLPSSDHPGGTAFEYAPIDASGAQLADLDAEPSVPTREELLEEGERARATMEGAGQGRVDQVEPRPDQVLSQENRVEEPIRQPAQPPGASKPESAFRSPQGMVSSLASGDASARTDSVGGKAVLDLAALRLKEAPADDRSGSDSLKNSFAVPGLKLVSVEWEERVMGERALLIRQLLSPGDTLELRYVGLLMGTDPKAGESGEGALPLEEASGRRAYATVLEASLPPGWNQVVMDRGRALLVARGPLPEANLKALLKTLH